MYRFTAKRAAGLPPKLGQIMSLTGKMVNGKWLPIL